MPRDTSRDNRERQLRKTGEGVSWRDWLFLPAGVRITGSSSPPRWAQYMDDGAGSNGVFGWHFDAGEWTPLQASQLDHDYFVGEDLEPHIHFKFQAAPVNGETVTWSVEYELGPVSGLGPSTTSTATGTYTIDTGVIAQWWNVILELTPDVDASALGLTISSVGSVTIERGGTYGSEVVFMGFDFHYPADSIGSDASTSKTY